MDRPVMLRDLSAGGFAVLSAADLTLGASYVFRFAIRPRTVMITARLAHAMRLSVDQAAGYLLGFEFTDTQRDEAAIAALVAEATTDRA